MKQPQPFTTSVILIFFVIAINIDVLAQDSAINPPSVNIQYFVKNNSAQYLLVQSRVKVGRKFNPLPGRTIRLYLDSNSSINLIANTITDETGKARIIIPPSFKDKWNSSNKHSFIAVLNGAPGKEAITSSLDIIKAKIALDTVYVDGTRTVNAKVMYLDNNNWLPAKDVEMKIGVARSGTILSANDKATFTTDSTGVATAEFKQQGLPGDQKGIFMLVAKVEDNEQYGNLLVEKAVPWGVITTPETDFFDQRTLWSTRFETPLWLLFTAYAIVVVVWGTIIYLVFQIVKIKKLGTSKG